jgi:CRP-like cAMP-binding protein
VAADTDEAFRQLNDAELAALRPFGVRRAVAAGDYLYREGDPGYDFYVVLAASCGSSISRRGACPS